MHCRGPLNAKSHGNENADGKNGPSRIPDTAAESIQLMRLILSSYQFMPLCNLNPKGTLNILRLDASFWKTLFIGEQMWLYLRCFRSPRLKQDGTKDSLLFGAPGVFFFFFLLPFTSSSPTLNTHLSLNDGHLNHLLLLWVVNPIASRADPRTARLLRSYGRFWTSIEFWRAHQSKT